jgi:predicted choloylglycine hydrolase
MTQTDERNPLEMLVTAADWRDWIAFGHACADFDWAEFDWARFDRARFDWARFDWARFDWAETTDRAGQRRGGTPPVSLTMTAIREDQPGSRWKALFDATWPAYRAWYAREGMSARPSLESCRDALRTHMPELLPTWRRLVALSDRDEQAARMLSLWNPPAYQVGCSQAVLPGPEPVLVRNYDYDLDLFEGVVTSTNLSGNRRVIGTSDCLWGLLDGMNEDGLVVSLAFGGRPGAGEGFGIPLVVRYLLETCASVAEARRALLRLPVAQAYNLTLADTLGAHVNAFVAPGEPACFEELAVATNHRHRSVEHPHVAEPLRSRERQLALLDLIAEGPSTDQLTAAFLRPPVHTRAYSRGFGTLYTACYEPARGQVTYLWPDRVWVRSFESPDDESTVTLHEQDRPRSCREVEHGRSGRRRHSGR